jgi:hypothetical protein
MVLRPALSHVSFESCRRSTSSVRSFRYTHVGFSESRSISTSVAILILYPLGRAYKCGKKDFEPDRMIFNLHRVQGRSYTPSDIYEVMSLHEEGKEVICFLTDVIQFDQLVMLSAFMEEKEFGITSE